MIVERLTVSGFRRLAAPLTFTPHERFTVVHAPNGTGKTTLLDALYFGLLERHSVSGDRARERFESAGRQLVPRIEIDFGATGARYRLTKTFFGAKSARLQRWEIDRYVPLMDGAAADDFVRDLFAADAPGRGAIEPAKHLGLAHVLWSPARASYDPVPGVARDHIRAMLGSEISAVTPGERDVADRVRHEYLRYFTARGAPAASIGSVNLPALQVKVAQARAAAVAAREQYDALESLRSQYEDRQADSRRMEAKREELRTELVRARSDAAVYAELLRSAERSALAERTARQACAALRAQIVEIAAIRRELLQTATNRTNVQAEISQFERDLTIADQRLRSAQQINDDANTQAAAVNARMATVNLACTYAEAYARATEAAKRLDAHAQSAELLHRQRTAQLALVAPTRDELEQIRERVADLNRLEATVAASALAIEIDADVDLTIEVIAAQTIGTRELRAGQSTSIAAADQLVAIDVPGLGRIRARGADGAADARKRALAVATQLEATWTRFGSRSLSELAARTEAAAELRRRIAELEQQCRSLLGGRSVDDLAAELAAATACLQGIEQTQPEWRADPPNVFALRAALQNDLAASSDRVRITSSALDAEHRARAALTEGMALARMRASEAAMTGARLAVRLSALENDALDDEARATKLDELELDWRTAKAADDLIRAKVADVAEPPDAIVARLELAEREAGDAFEDGYAQAATCLALLDEHARRAPYAKLSESEERLGRAERELADAQARSEAMRV